MALTMSGLRAHALGAAFLQPTTLPEAIAKMGFVQADPIRAPARAQDLILRHRVAGYRAGDLERRFIRLGLEEDFLHAYGFMPPETMRLLHPRPDPRDRERIYSPIGLDAEVLATVRERGATHPRDLEARFGRARRVNAWGGFSKETTHCLHRLHHQGLLRVVDRRDGIRIYAAATPPEPLDPDERRRRLILLITRNLAPIPDASLRSTLTLLRRGAPGLGPPQVTIAALLRSGALECGALDGQNYLWPASYDRTAPTHLPNGVRFLAPFDPLVWDRRRFEHLWGWPYRFEAYTPAARRKFGYYAMPMVWRDRMIGWANVAIQAKHLAVTPGFVGSPPRGCDFRRAYAAEVARMEAFLGLKTRKA